MSYKLLSTPQKQVYSPPNITLQTKKLSHGREVWPQLASDRARMGTWVCLIPETWALFTKPQNAHERRLQKTAVSSVLLQMLTWPESQVGLHGREGVFKFLVLTANGTCLLQPQSSHQRSWRPTYTYPRRYHVHAPPRAGGGIPDVPFPTLLINRLAHKSL